MYHKVRVQLTTVSTQILIMCMLIHKSYVSNSRGIEKSLDHEITALEYKSAKVAQR